MTGEPLPAHQHGAGRIHRRAGEAIARGFLHVGARDLTERAETLRGEGQTVMFVVVDGGPAGLFGVADPVKETTPGANPGAAGNGSAHRHADR